MNENSNTSKPLHLIGNAHIDPVWLWRFPDGLSEIKATFRSALDRIREYDDFIFSCACASYYYWVEKNCPPLFAEIREAVQAGKWIIVGGMWIQPDCNMPSTESFARQMLYSQLYFKEKFGVQAVTGYNVDSFGHSAGLPRLLREGGMKNYVYMRPSAGAEMKYPFADRAFRWHCGDDEVLTYRLPCGYAQNYTDEEQLVNHVRSAEPFPYPSMIFYGVGNHGGGPTITNLEIIHAYQQHTPGRVELSHPNRYFDILRTEHAEQIPDYTGELQNHASGCYAANSKIKLFNRACENRLNESERLSVLAAACTDHPLSTDANRTAWEKVMFNQFHDILAGCCTKAAYDDAYAFAGAAITHALTSGNAALQRISWAINTDRGVSALSKERLGALWESNDLGTPIVVFNPLSHPVHIPVAVHLHACSAVTDEEDNPIPHQMIRADFTNRVLKTRLTGFIADVPAYGWRTYWVYRNRVMDRTLSPVLQIGPNRLANDRITVSFNPTNGEISSIKTATGELLGEFGCRTLVLDDSPYDTWAHGQFVFEGKIGEFGNPTFDIVDKGEYCVSLQVKQTWQHSSLVRTYSLYPGDDTLYVDTRLVLGDERVMIKFAFDAGLPEGEFIREVPGDVLTTYPAELSLEQAGRELPMLRWMAIREGNKGLAVLNNGKYSASCRDGELRMVAARSCFYGDHYGQRDGLLQAQDIGEQEFRYAIRACGSDLTPVARAAEELNTVFPVITETYHKGTLPQTASFSVLNAENVTISCIKQAEDGRGLIIRLNETAGRNTTCRVKLFDVEFSADLTPFAIQSYRLTDGRAERCNFLEEAAAE